MKSAGIILLTLTLSISGSHDASAAGAARVAGRAPAAPVSLDEYFKIHRVGGGAFSYDEQSVAYVSNESGKYDIWVTRVSGGKPQRVTDVNGGIYSFAFRPMADGLIYEADDSGNELSHLYLIDSIGGEPRDLTPHDPPSANNHFVRWAADGETFLYQSSRRDENYLDLYEYDMATGASTLLWQSGGALSFERTSRDLRRFVISETVSDVNSNLYLVERGATEPPRLLTPHDADVWYQSTEFSLDGETLYYLSDEGGEFTSLRAMSLHDRESRVVREASWDIDNGYLSETGRIFCSVTNEDGSLVAKLTEGIDGAPIRPPDLGSPGTLLPLAFSRTDRLLVATLVTDAAPVDLYLIDFEAGSTRRLTESLPESLRGLSMARADAVRIRSFDGRDVPAFLYRPTGVEPHPAIISVHGGPTAQSKRGFDPFTQYLVSKGYVVLVPNVRGSTGYGKTYVKLDNLDLGGGPLQDVVACKKWLVENENVRADQVVVMGGSYGGYMALAAAAFTPTEFGALVDFFGPSDLKSLVESFPAAWATYATYLHAKFGDPGNPAHAQYQHDRSPLYFVDRIQRPVLVVQGTNDARVKQDQSERLVARLRERGAPVHYLLIEGEGHGFTRDETRLEAYRATDAFLDRYIYADESAALPK